MPSKLKKIPALLGVGSSIPHGSPLSPMVDPQPPVPPVIDYGAAGTSPVLTQAPIAPQAPAAPPALPTPPAGVIARKKYKPFSKENRSEALLAIGNGLLSRPNSFAEGIGAAGENLGNLRHTYDEKQKPQSAMGGPDNAFEITTDPETGARTFKPVAEYTSYLDKKRKADKAPSPEDNVTLRSNTAAAILDLPEEQQAAAYAALRYQAKMDGYNLNLPEEYAPSALKAWAGQSVSPEKRMTFAQAAEKRKADQANRDRTFGLQSANADRAERRFQRGPSKSSASVKPPAGFVWDN